MPPAALPGVPASSVATPAISLARPRMCRRWQRLAPGRSSAVPTVTSATPALGTPKVKVRQCRLLRTSSMPARWRSQPDQHNCCLRPKAAFLPYKHRIISYLQREGGAPLLHWQAGRHTAQGWRLHAVLPAGARC